MVLVQDDVNEFFHVLSRSKVLVLVNIDVDGLCSWKILQHLLQSQQIKYSVNIVTLRGDIQTQYQLMKRECKYFILLNCGCFFDVVDYLSADNEDTIFFIIDSARPIHIHNIYNRKQIRILLHSDLIEDETRHLPQLSDVINGDFDNDDSDDESSSDSENDDENLGEGMKRIDRRIKRNEKKQEWLRRREEILFEYMKYSYHSKSSALLLFNLSWKLSLDTTHLLWYACVGVSDQYIHYKIDFDRYQECVIELQSHVLRHSHRLESMTTMGNEILQCDQVNENVSSLNEIYFNNIHSRNEINLTLLRHWSLYESMNYSIATMLLFKTWSVQGKQHLREFLADLGIPIIQAQQSYQYMESKYRNNLPLHLQLEKNQRKYGYETSDLFVDTFVTIYGHKDEVNALDAARIIQAIIENPSDKLHYTMARNHFYKMHGTHSNSQSIRSSQESFTSTIDKPSQDLFNETTGQANGEKNNEKNNSVITMVNGSGFSRLELALHCLNRHSNFLCTNGVAVAKKHLMQLLTQICILLESNTISSTNSFLYLMLDKKLQDSYNLGYVVTLRLLSTYLLILFTVINSKKKNKKMRRLPFIISCDTQTFPDHYLVLSVPSLSTIDGEDGEYHGSTLCNMMTAAFTANATISPDLRCYFEFFDNSAFLIDKDQRQDFLNSLDDVLNE